MLAAMNRKVLGGNAGVVFISQWFCPLTPLLSVLGAFCYVGMSLTAN